MYSNEIEVRSTTRYQLDSYSHPHSKGQVPILHIETHRLR